MKHVFIVNPVSGKADASGTLVPQIITEAKRLGAVLILAFNRFFSGC